MASKEKRTGQAVQYTTAKGATVVSTNQTIRQVGQVGSTLVGMALIGTAFYGSQFRPEANSGQGAWVVKGKVY